jgi:hypothetical protein
MQRYVGSWSHSGRYRNLEGEADPGDGADYDRNDVRLPQSPARDNLLGTVASYESDAGRERPSLSSVEMAFVEPGKSDDAVLDDFGFALQGGGPALDFDSRVSYFSGFLWIRLRSLTPGPPPFSSMKSTPADSSAWRTARSLAAVNEVALSTTSARRMVFTPRADARARSSALHFRSARPALICELVKGLNFTLTTIPRWMILTHMGIITQ